MTTQPPPQQDGPGATMDTPKGGDTTSPPHEQAQANGDAYAPKPSPKPSHQTSHTAQPAESDSTTNTPNDQTAPKSTTFYLTVEAEPTH